jgi:hypothetical protein
VRGGGLVALIQTCDSHVDLLVLEHSRHEENVEGLEGEGARKDEMGGFRQEGERKEEGEERPVMVL